MSGVPHDSAPGESSWRDEDGHKRSPVFTGYESEQNAVVVEGRIVSECEAYRIASGVAESERRLFGEGWRAAADGKPPFTSALDPTDVAWLHGWNAYPRNKWEDPYAGFTEDYAARLTLERQDDMTREIKTKEAKRRQRVG